MTEAELSDYIRTNYPRENTAHEWKGWTSLRSNVSSRKADDLISYVSGIANMEGGAIVIGVKDGTFEISGIDTFHDYTPENLPHRLCGSCTNLSSEGLRVEAHETSDTGKTVWIVHIPKHQPRLPVYAHKAIWQRNGDSLVPMRPERMHAILSEPLGVVDDWSRGVIPNATLKALDPQAILMARRNFKGKFPHLAGEVDQWTDETFLNKAKVCINGQVTRTAIILLGLPESTHYLDGPEAMITWILKDKDNIELDYAHFGPPFLLNVERAYEKIRNLKYRYIREKTLFPDELDMYDPFVIREALHNCVAHKDYPAGGKILLVEHPDRLIFANDGSFLPGTVEAAIERDRPTSQSRNPFLANAMFQLNMIDTIGSGIKRMFLAQRKRYFPLPDYELRAGEVEMRLYGKVIDLEYTRLLARHEDLSLPDVMLLDRVQKDKEISLEEATRLKAIGCLEGRRPNYHLSAKISVVIGEKATYIKNRGFDDNHYKTMIMSMIEEFGSASKQEIRELIYDKLPDILNDSQKKNKVNTLITALRRSGSIVNHGSKPKPEWKLNKTQ